MGMVVSQPRCACVVGTDASSITGYAPLKPRPGRRAHQGRGGRAVAVREGRPRLGGGLSAPWRALNAGPTGQAANADWQGLAFTARVKKLKCL